MPLTESSILNRLITALRSRFLRLFLGLILLAVFAAQSAGMLPFSFIDKMDGVLYDVKLRWHAPGGVDPRIVIVDIDEASLKEREQGGEGRWPWPRDRLAVLMDRLFDDYDHQVFVRLNPFRKINSRAMRVFRSN
jgi:adenylate cyclase